MRRSLELENDCADTVADKGYRVHQNPTRREIAEARQSTGDVGKPDKEPDYLIEGHVFDCYSPTPGKAVRGVWTEVSGKVSSQQTQRVVLNLRDWRGELGALRKQFDDWPIHQLKELTAVTRSGEIIQLVRRD
ncbi:CdiA C-terminal domain-containing protein [Micromonospora sp. NPDC003241]